MFTFMSQLSVRLCMEKYGWFVYMYMHLDERLGGKQNVSNGHYDD